MRDVEAYFRDEHDPPVMELFARWRRNRAFFEETQGFTQRPDHQLMLRENTEEARRRLAIADQDWEDVGFPTRGRQARRWRKARFAFLKAVHEENLEYESVLIDHGFDPDDDVAIADLFETVRSEPES